MTVRNRARLRNTLRKLQGAAGAQIHPADAPVAAQEALDLLAVMAGIKPVMLLGRGYNEPTWIKAVLQAAVDAGLKVVEGPFWDASADAGAGADLPDWFLDHSRHAIASHRAWYICRAKAVADEVARICETAAITVGEEARLLDYPECCVRAHYAAAADYQRIWLDLLRRKAGGDDAKARELLAAGAALDPETDDDRARLEAAMASTPAPFTSINMCAGCVVAGRDSPAMRRSAAYRALAGEVDAGLVQSLAKSRSGIGR